MKQCTRTNDNDSSMHKTKLHTLIGKAVSDTRQLSLPRRLRSLVIEGRRRVIKQRFTNFVETIIAENFTAEFPSKTEATVTCAFEARTSLFLLPGPAEALFQKEYFQLMRSALREGGIVCSQGKLSARSPCPREVDSRCPQARACGSTWTWWSA